MAGRSAQSRRVSQDAAILLKTPERARRSLSQGDDTPRPPGVLIGASTPPTLNNDSGSPPNSYSPVDQPTASKRLGFLSEKLSLSSNSASSSATLRASPAPLLTSRSHSRAESALNIITRDTTASPTHGMSATSPQSTKGHTSPSKATARTYDSKLVSREMHRLGNLAHLPSLAPTLSSASTVNLNAQGNTSNITSISATENPWATLHVYVLPLFNGEPLRVPIEDLNSLVKRHIQGVISSAPSKALATLEHDASELIASGMVTLNAKLSGVDEEKVVSRLVEIWGFFWDQVLPYVEGALLPLQTDSLLSSLYRMPKAHKPNSPGAQNGMSSMSSLTLASTQQIDVRTIALQLFRDSIILPAFPKLNARLLYQREQASEAPGYQQPRLQQMLLVLVSQRPFPSVMSLTEPTPPPTPGEEAIQRLLRTIRTPLVNLSPNRHSEHSGRGAPSFLSAGLPRDRRGRIAGKSDPRSMMAKVLDEEEDGGETPRLGGQFVTEPVRDKEREFLESLRSPDPEAARVSMGGWGLGVGYEEIMRKGDEEEEEELPADWDQAQAVVERMVGMKMEQRRAPVPV
ncbi:HbrB-domain-containing protein [Cristinia sonorae]|uniref:HbrB-domain-containing protein n=1 Tax=Cristinia sonorae TaxID=1940300 RepID=A0A8K0UY63_9AGAR|nr:HbrB-domain-containing protein [Cristinia sonorae]